MDVDHGKDWGVSVDELGARLLEASQAAAHWKGVAAAAQSELEESRVSLARLEEVLCEKCRKEMTDGLSEGQLG